MSLLGAVIWVNANGRVCEGLGQQIGAPLRQCSLLVGFLLWLGLIECRHGAGAFGTHVQEIHCLDREQHVMYVDNATTNHFQIPAKLRLRS